MTDQAQPDTPPVMKKVKEPGKIAGFKIDFGADELIVPPLNIEGVEAHEQDIQRIQDLSTPLKERMNLICGVIVSALQRNYPDKKIDYVKKWVDMGNVEDIFSAIMAQSGFKEGKAGEK